MEPKTEAAFKIEERNHIVSIYSISQISDELLIDLVMYLIKRQHLNPRLQLDTLVLPNCTLSDAALNILFEFLSAHRTSLTSLKLYNNILSLLVTEKREIPYLLYSTKQLARCLWDPEDPESVPALQYLELHGFFMHSEDIPEVCRSLARCRKMVGVFLSNNNL